MTETFNGALHCEDGIVVRYGVEEAISTPRPINAHDADAIAPAEGDAFRTFGEIRHRVKAPPSWRSSVRPFQRPNSLQALPARHWADRNRADPETA